MVLTCTIEGHTKDKFPYEEQRIYYANTYKTEQSEIEEVPRIFPEERKP